jgi:signal transduction histidine kinase/DNA-binding response OmpR family regulator
MDHSLRYLRLKIMTGYVVLAILFLSALFFVYNENHKLGAISEQANGVLAQRQQTEEVITQILDMSLLGEQMMVWDDEDLSKYFQKKDAVVSSLIKLKQQLCSEKQQQCLDTILSLLDEKEVHILAILNNLESLRGAYNIVQKRIPSIIKKNREQQEKLTKEVQQNIENNRKRTNGLLNIFHSKKKSIELTDQENRKALQNSQSRSEAMLRSMETEIELTRTVNSEQLVNNVDSLKIRNNFLNREISRMVSELSQEDQKLRCDATEKYLRVQERTIHAISITGLAALLLSIFFYWLLHRDLNERHRNRTRLELLNRKNEELLNVRKNMMLAVSHDLRAPLASITGYAELISDERKKENRIRYSEVIRQSSDRMLLLLNSLLNFYRLDTGKELPETGPFRLKNLIEILIAEFTPQAEKKNLKLTGEYFGDDVVVTGDRSRLLQIISNLLSNAIKFTFSGYVRIIIDYANERLTVKVEDTGMGMSKEQTDKIFQPFERLPNAETEDGFGLGLSVTLALINLLGGQIKVNSHLGKGSLFTVNIPLPVSTKENILQQNTQTTTDTLAPNIHIVVVDNDAVMLAMTTDMFSRHKVHCDGCRNAKELMEMMRGCNYDLVITDIVMPDINGFQLLELLRTSNISNAKSVPVLAMTARAERSVDEFIKAGFAGCLYKPFSRFELFTAVRNSTSGHAKQILPCADFSVVLSGERNRNEMLSLLVNETDKNMNFLKEGLEKNDLEIISTLTHQLMPLWEIVQIDAPLKELLQALSKADKMDNTVSVAVQKVLTAGLHLIKQANEMSEKSGDE